MRACGTMRTPLAPCEPYMTVSFSHLSHAPDHPCFSGSNSWFASSAGGRGAVRFTSYQYAVNAARCPFAGNSNL